MADLRVAMVGTPDVPNLGDLLFPLIARRELRRRLGDVSLTTYGYRAISGDHWPYAVRSLGDLPEEIASYDLLLIGGGHIVRDDAAVAPGYAPSDPRVHQPLGLWLTPALLAHAAGVPVAWNAVGVSERLSPSLAPLVQAALGASGYVAVRDEPSARALEALAPDTALHIVPDTAFGTQAVLGRKVRREARALLAGAGIGDRPYVVVQSTDALSHVRLPVEEALRAVRDRDRAVLELPIGPVLGDRVGALDLPDGVAALESWPGPAVLAALLAGAETVIAQSLHANIVAFSAGVRCLRMPMPSGEKYDQLDGLPHVHLLGRNGATSAIAAGPVNGDVAGAAAREALRGRLEAHWDAVAALARRSGARRARGPFLRFVAGLPAREVVGSEERAALEQQVELGAEYEAAYRAFAVRADELAGRLAVADGRAATLDAERAGLQAALAAAEQRAAAAEAAAALARDEAVPPGATVVGEAELAYLRARDDTLQRILDGGWWQLRTRLRPLLWVATLVRRAAGR